VYKLQLKTLTLDWRRQVAEDNTDVEIMRSKRVCQSICTAQERMACIVVVVGLISVAVPKLTESNSLV